GVQYRVAGGQPDGRPGRPGGAQPLVVGGGDHQAPLQQLAEEHVARGPEGAAGAEPEAGGGAAVGQPAGPVPPGQHRPAASWGGSWWGEHGAGHGEVGAVEAVGVVQDRPRPAAGPLGGAGDRDGADERARRAGRQRGGRLVEGGGGGRGG